MKTTLTQREKAALKSALQHTNKDLDEEVLLLFGKKLTEEAHDELEYNWTLFQCDNCSTWLDINLRSPDPQVCVECMKFILEPYENDND